MTEASRLASPNGLRSLTFATLFGLIAATGIRVSEALSLDSDDIDWEAGVLTIRRGKAGKARLIPVSKSAIPRLAAYTAKRNRLLGKRPKPFFVTDSGGRPNDCTTRYNFAVVCQRIGLRPAQRFNKHGRGPRIHDLRHTFAARTLVNWYRTGKDPDREMLKLSTIWDTPNRHTPIGISRRSRSCWSWPQSGRTVFCRGRLHDEPFDTSGAATALLHRPPDDLAGG